MNNEIKVKPQKNMKKSGKKRRSFSACVLKKMVKLTVFGVAVGACAYLLADKQRLEKLKAQSQKS